MPVLTFYTWKTGVIDRALPRGQEADVASIQTRRPIDGRHVIVRRRFVTRTG
ncbi:MAG: hypothetical protein ABI910_04145 [Gemmatimonadota bacterium]